MGVTYQLGLLVTDLDLLGLAHALDAERHVVRLLLGGLLVEGAADGKQHNSERQPEQDVGGCLILQLG